MYSLKRNAAASIVVAFFSSVSLADEAMPVTYPAGEQEATSQTCQQARETAAIYRELDKTDGNVATNEPLPKCDGDSNT